jgi:hypothetical protein
MVIGLLVGLFGDDEKYFWVGPFNGVGSEKFQVWPKFVGLEIFFMALGPLKRSIGDDEKYFWADPLRQGRSEKSQVQPWQVELENFFMALGPLKRSIGDDEKFFWAGPRTRALARKMSSTPKFGRTINFLENGCREYKLASTTKKYFLLTVNHFPRVWASSRKSR